MTSTTILPPPYKGQNSRFPLVAIQNPFCERLSNFNIRYGSLKLRNGNDLWNTVSAITATLSLDSYEATTPLLIITIDKSGTSVQWSTVTTQGTVTGVHATTTGTATTEAYSLFFNGYLVFFGNGDLNASVDGPQAYSGSAWAAMGWTYPASFNPFGGDVFKARAYLIKEASSSYGYSGIAATSGAITQVDLGEFLSSKAYLRIIRPISLTQNLTAEAVQAFVFSNGEVLVYGGSYPESDTWGIKSRFKISKPLYQNSFVDAKGDSFLLTETEILSLRNLYISGYDKERSEGIGAVDQPRWAQITKALINGGTSYTKLIKGVYDERNDRLVISLPTYVNPITGAITAGTPFKYIYDFLLGAWYEHFEEDSRAPQAYAACYHKNDVFEALGTASTTYIVKLEGSTDFVDDQLDGSGTNAIAYKAKLAPLPISKFGANEISGVEVICKSDLYPQTNYKFIADLGKQESGNQPLPAQGNGIEKPMLNVGIQGASVAQLEIHGSSVTCTYGLEIYAFNVWYEAGEKASR